MICQILLAGMDQNKLERGIVEMGANKIIILTPNKDKYYAISRSIVKKFESIAETEIIPILDMDTFTFTQSLKRILSDNFRKYELRINASTDVRNWKILAYFSVKQFYPYLQELSTNRIIFYEVVGGPAPELSKYEYVPEFDDEELLEQELKIEEQKEEALSKSKQKETKINKNSEEQEDLTPKDIEADKESSKKYIKGEIKYFDDVWGKPNKRPAVRIEIYPIDTLSSLEQYIVDIISRQDLTIDQIKGEYSILCDKYVTTGLLSRYLGVLRDKGLVGESRSGKNKLFRLTDYGLKYVLPIIKPSKTT